MFLYLVQTSPCLKVGIWLCNISKSLVELLFFFFCKIQMLLGDSQIAFPCICWKVLEERRSSLITLSLLEIEFKTNIPFLILPSIVSINVHIRSWNKNNFSIPMRTFWVLVQTGLANPSPFWKMAKIAFFNPYIYFDLFLDKCHNTKVIWEPCAALNPVARNPFFWLLPAG